MGEGSGGRQKTEGSGGGKGSKRRQGKGGGTKGKKKSEKGGKVGWGKGVGGQGEQGGILMGLGEIKVLRPKHGR